MNTLQRVKWKHTRTIGFWRFVLLSTLVFSGSMNIAMSVFDYFVNPSEVRFQYLIKSLIWLVSGFMGGVMLWFYAEYKSKKDDGNGS